MANSMSSEQRRAFLSTLDAVGKHWLSIFDGDISFYSADYWDLFANMWKEAHDYKKTVFIRNEVNSFVKVGPKKAAVLIDNAIKKGYLEAIEDPRDRRQRAVRMSDQLTKRMNSYLDAAVAEVGTHFQISK